MLIEAVASVARVRRGEGRLGEGDVRDCDEAVGGDAEDFLGREQEVLYLKHAPAVYHDTEIASYRGSGRAAWFM